MYIKTNNELFNTINGGGYKQGKLYMLFIDYKHMGLIQKLGIIPVEDVMHDTLRYYEDIKEIGDIIDIRNKCMRDNKPGVILNYLKLTERLGEGIHVSDHNYFNASLECDTCVSIIPIVEKDCVRFEITKQRQNIRHGLMYPYIQKNVYFE